MIDFLSTMTGQFSHFHFLRPWWLAMMIPFLGVFAYLWKAKSPTDKWRKIIAPHLMNAMLVRQGRTSWFNPISVSVLSLTFGLLAMSGPTWKQQPSPFSEDIAALVIVLDVSSSMQQKDIQPSRLERAKQKVQDLLALRPGGRVGLIVYSGTAHSVIPLTSDPDVVNNFLSAVQTRMMPRKGKFPEKALPIAEQMLRDSPIPGTILMIGDGVSPKTRDAFNEYFSDNNHQLLILGIGEVASTSAENDDALIPLESAALETLAADNGGYYQSLTLDRGDVQKLDRRISNYFVIVDDANRPWVDAGYYFLYPMALVMLLWFRVGWTLQWCLALVFVSGLALSPPAMASDEPTEPFINDQSSNNQSSTNQSSNYRTLASRFLSWWLTPDQQGRYYLEKGEYRKAAASFENISWRGIAYYRGENFNAAAEMFSRVETVDGFFNLGNAFAHGRDYLLAVKAYDKVLELDPENKGALKNRARLQSIIDEINLLSASQKAEESDSSRELSDEQPQTADGAERQDFKQREVEQLTAEEVLLDEQINELWMRQVQKDPSRFLSAKFYMQLERRKREMTRENHNDE